MSEMSGRQSYAIRCASGLDVRNVSMEYDVASDYIRYLNDRDTYDAAVESLQGKGATGTPKEYVPYVKGQKKSKKTSQRKSKNTVFSESAKDRANRELFERAIVAGKEAAETHEAVPMVVQEHANVLDDSSPVVKTYAPAMGGVCGFAFAIIKPGNCSFALWLKKTGNGDYSDYWRGVLVIAEDVKYNGQSLSSKESFNNAFARVVGAEGIRVDTRSWMD